MAAPRRIVFAAVVALCAGLTAVVRARRASARPCRSGARDGGRHRPRRPPSLFGGAIALGLRLADWREPETEEDFERSSCAASGSPRRAWPPSPTRRSSWTSTRYDDEDFEELVRDALDDLPDLLRARAGAQRRRRDLRRRPPPRRLRPLPGRRCARATTYPDRIIIFRDTLRRDFGHDPELLRDQVMRTVRHELAHHVGLRRARRASPLGAGAAASCRASGASPAPRPVVPKLQRCPPWRPGSPASRSPCRPEHPPRRRRSAGRRRRRPRRAAPVPGRAESSAPSSPRRRACPVVTAAVVDPPVLAAVDVAALEPDARCRKSIAAMASR